MQDEPVNEMLNSIEYDGLVHEIETQLELQPTKQPETISHPKTSLETEQPEVQQEQNKPEYQEAAKSQVNTGLDYDIPEHLKSRMMAVDTQSFRVANYEVGTHLLR